MAVVSDDQEAGSELLRSNSLRTCAESNELFIPHYHLSTIITSCDPQPDEDIYVTAIIEWSCAPIPAHRTQWQFEQISNSTPSQISITAEDQLVFYVSSKSLSADAFRLSFTMEINVTRQQSFTEFRITRKTSDVRPRLIQNNVTELVHLTKNWLPLNPTLSLNDPQVVFYSSSPCNVLDLRLEMDLPLFLPIILVHVTISTGQRFETTVLGFRQ